MKAQTVSFESNSLVRRPLRKSSDQETKIRSIFSQSAPTLDPHAATGSNVSLSNSSSPLCHKQSSTYLTTFPEPSSLEKNEIKVSHLFAAKSEKLKTPDSHSSTLSKAQSPLLPSLEQKGKVAFTSTPINISFTYHSSASSSSSNTKSESSNYNESFKKSKDANIFPFDPCCGGEKSEKTDSSEFSEKEKCERVFSSEESTDDEDSWIEELYLKKRKERALDYLGEEEDWNQSVSSNQDASSSKFKLKNIPSSPNYLFIDNISPFRLTDSKKKLSESDEFY